MSTLKSFMKGRPDQLRALQSRFADPFPASLNRQSESARHQGTGNTQFGYLKTPSKTNDVESKRFEPGWWHTTFNGNWTTLLNKASITNLNSYVINSFVGCNCEDSNVSYYVKSESPVNHTCPQQKSPTLQTQNSHRWRKHNQVYFLDYKKKSSVNSIRKQHCYVDHVSMALCTLSEICEM